jgi:hypothetical protein
MRLTKNLGDLLLAIFLILLGLSYLGLSLPGGGLIMGILAIVAGVLKLLGR